MEGRGRLCATRRKRLRETRVCGLLRMSEGVLRKLLLVTWRESQGWRDRSKVTLTLASEMYRRRWHSLRTRPAAAGSWRVSGLQLSRQLHLRPCAAPPRRCCRPGRVSAQRCAGASKVRCAARLAPPAAKAPWAVPTGQTLPAPSARPYDAQGDCELFSVRRLCENAATDEARRPLMPGGWRRRPPRG